VAFGLLAHFRGIEMRDTQTIVYIGRRELHKDTLYGTGEWAKGQHKLVDVVVALKMLRHPDVFEAGKVEAVSTDVVPAPKAKPKDNDISDDVQEALYAINNMNADAIASFVSENFQQKVDRRKSVENLRIEATRLLHQFGLAA
jgi:hypothetical protein